MTRASAVRGGVAAWALAAGLFVAAFPARGTADDPEAKEREDEAKKWAVHSKKAEDALAFWIGFLDFRHGADNKTMFDATGDPKGALRARIVCVIRAISWVESKHGTGTGGSAAVDPMQCGNPKDKWWRELTGQEPKVSRFIGGPNAKNYNANELPEAAAKQANFPADAKLSVLGDAKKGHTDPKFNATMSYYWGIVYFAHRTNTRMPTPGHAQVYKFDDCKMDRLVDGAVEYNGGGDPMYRMKIEAAIKLIGCP